MSLTHADHRPRTFIIGLDGATFDLIRPWAAAGKLPTFQKLLHEGVQADLTSVIPPVTPPAWTSFMTGMNPAKHGVFNFIDYLPHDHSIRYTNAAHRQVQTVWKYLSDLGCRVGIVNVPMTYPPERVEGYCISGLDTPDKEADFVHPAWLKAELEQAVGEIYLDPRHLGYMTTDDKRDRVLETLAAIARRRTDMAAYLLRHHPVDVMMLVYTATDTVQHFFWGYMDPDAPLYHTAGAEKYRDAVYDLYRLMDTNMATLLELLPEDCATVVVSDHGGGPVSPHVLHLNQFLAELGLLTYKHSSSGIAGQLFQRLTSGLDEYLRGALAPHQKAWLARRFPSIREKWEARTSSLGRIDWPRTQAYALEVLSFPSEIWLNVAGRTPYGTVAPGAEYERVVAFLTSRLYDLRDEAGKPLIRRVYRKEDVYAGPYMERAPDLVLSWWDAPGIQVRRSTPGAPHASLQHQAAAESTTATWNGTHRLHGMLLLHGPPFRRGVTLPQAHITDIAPTLLYLLGFPVPSEMDGTVLLEAFRDDLVASRPVQYQAGCWAGQPGASAELAFTAQESARIRARLQGLGYID